MIEAMLMMGVGKGPESPWEYIGVRASATSSQEIVGEFPTAVQPGDLVVAVISARNYNGNVSDLPMVTTGWLAWGYGSGNARVDVVCATLYKEGMPLPVWEQPYSRYVRVAVFAYRGPGWKTVRLEQQNVPMDRDASVTTRTRNTLILNIGITPDTVRSWYSDIGGISSRYQRYDAEGSPALYLMDANVAAPQAVEGIYVDASNGAERNYILTAY